MAFDDYLRQNFPQMADPNPQQAAVPTLPARVRFTAMPNTQPGDAARQIVNEQDQAIMAGIQAQRNQQLGQQMVAESRASLPQDQGGGYLDIFSNVWEGIQQAPQVMSQAFGNALENPLSPRAWGGAALSVGAAPGAILGLPLDYMKETWGNILYAAATDDVGWLEQAMTMLPGIGLVLKVAFEGANLVMPDDLRQTIINAHDDNYNGYEQGRGVWEAMQGKLDTLPDSVRYPLRIALEVANDPLTWVGIGTIGKAGQLGRMGRSAEEFAALNRRGRMGAVLSDVVQSRDPILAIDTAARAISAPADMVMFGLPARAARGVLGRTGLFDQAKATMDSKAWEREGEAIQEFGQLTEPNVMPVDAPMKTNDIGQLISTAQIGDPARGAVMISRLTDGSPDPLPGFNLTYEVPPGAGKVRMRIIATDQNTGATGLIEVLADGTVMVRPPNMTQWQPVMTVDQALDYVAVTRPNPIRADGAIGPNPSYEQMQRSFAQGAIPPDRRPQRSLTVTSYPDPYTNDIWYEFTHDTRGTAYARKEQNGYYTLFDQDRNPLIGPQAVNIDDVYDRLTNHLLQQPYRWQTDPYGRRLHPAWAPNPNGDRVIDQMYREAVANPDDPTTRWFWDQYQVASETYTPALDAQQALIDQVHAQDLRRDLQYGDTAAAMRGGLTVDTPAKTILETNMAVLADVYGSQALGDGMRTATTSRGWAGNPSQIILRIENDPGYMRRAKLNTADAIREAMLTDDESAANIIISHFRDKRKDYLSGEVAQQALLPGAVLARTRLKDGRYRLSDVLAANRQRRREMLGERGDVPMEIPTTDDGIIPDSYMLPAGDITPPTRLPQVRRLGPDDFSQPGMSTTPADLPFEEVVNYDYPPGRTPLPSRIELVDTYEALRARWSDPANYERPQAGPLLRAQREAIESMDIVLDPRSGTKLPAREAAWTRAQHFLREEERLRYGTTTPITETVTTERFIPPTAARIKRPQPVEPLGMSTGGFVPEAGGDIARAERWAAEQDRIIDDMVRRGKRPSRATIERAEWAHRAVDRLRQQPGDTPQGQPFEPLGMSRGGFVPEPEPSIVPEPVIETPAPVVPEATRATTDARKATHKLPPGSTGAVAKEKDAYRARIRDENGPVYTGERFPTREQAQRDLDEAMSGRPSPGAPVNNMIIEGRELYGAVYKPFYAAPEVDPAQQAEVESALLGLTEPEPAIVPETVSALPPAPVNKDLPKLADLPDAEDDAGLLRLAKRTLARSTDPLDKQFEDIKKAVLGFGAGITEKRRTAARRYFSSESRAETLRQEMAADRSTQLTEKLRALRKATKQGERSQLWADVQRLQREYDEIANAADDQVFDVWFRLNTVAPEPVIPEVAPTPPAASAPETVGQPPSLADGDTGAPTWMPTTELPEPPPPLARAPEFTPTVDEPVTELSRFQKAGQTRRMNRLAQEPGVNAGADTYQPLEVGPATGQPGRIERTTVERNVPIDPNAFPEVEPWSVPDAEAMTPQKALDPNRIAPSPVTTIEGQTAASRNPSAIVTDAPFKKRVAVDRRSLTRTRAVELWEEAVNGADDDTRNAALDALVYDITGGNIARDEMSTLSSGLEVDDALSGIGTYTIRNAADDVPAIQLRREGNELVVAAPGGSDDPLVKNIVARAGDVPVRVERGFGEPTGTPYGLKGPESTASEPLWDPVYRLWRVAKLGDEERDLLNEVVEISGGKNPKTMRVADLYLMKRAESETMDAAIDETLKVFMKHRTGEFRKGQEAAGRHSRKRAGEILRKYDALTDNIRERLMFNPYTGGVAALLDHLGDTARMLSMGEFGAVKRAWKPSTIYAAFKSAGGDTSWWYSSDPGQVLAKLGIDIPTGIAINVGREGLDRSRRQSFDDKLAKWALNPKADRLVKRAMAATGMRGSEFMIHLRSGGDLARRGSVMADHIIKNMPQYRDDFFNDTTVLKIFGKYGDFDVDAFRAELGDLFSADDVMAMAITRGMREGDAQQLARRWKAQHKLIEDAGVARAGDVLFTYDQTNLDQALRRVFLFHYWYSRASVAYTRTILRNPYLYVNYLRMTEGLEEMSEGKPSAIKGMIKAFTGPGGYELFMDPLKAVTTGVTFAQAAYKDGDEKAWDEFLDDTGLFFNPMLAAATAVLGITSNERVDPMATFQIRRIYGAGLNAANAMTGWEAGPFNGGQYLGTPFQSFIDRAVEDLSGLIPGMDPNYAKDAAATDKAMIRNGIMDRVMAEYGIESGTEFGLWPEEAVNVLQEALDAFDQGRPNPYADASYRDWSLGNLSRVGVGLVAPVRTSLRQQGRDERMTNARGPVANPYDAERDIANAAPGLSTDLTIQDARFDSLFPASAEGRMSTSPLTGQSQSEVLANPNMQVYASYREWKNAARDYGEERFRDQMRRMSPSYDAYIREFENNEEIVGDPDYFNNRSVDYQAFLAAQGQKRNLYSRTPPPALDPSRIDASSFITGGGAALPGQRDPNLTNVITGQLIGYQQQQQEFNQLVQQYFGQEVVFDLLSPQGQQLIRSQLGPLGVRIPTLGREAAGYQAWARAQPVGSDTSIDTYVAWLRGRIATGQNTNAVPMQAQM